MADRVERLRQAAQERHDATSARARQTLDALRRDALPITTFHHLAKTACVSRSWLYRQPDLREEIERLRRSPPARTNAQSSQRASADSLRQQLHIYREEIARLRAENGALKDQLARQLGMARAASVTKGS